MYTKHLKSVLQRTSCLVLQKQQLGRTAFFFLFLERLQNAMQLDQLTFWNI